MIQDINSSRTKPALSIFSIAPRGFSRAEAARYVCVSPTLFDALVRSGRMPQPIYINSKPVWDRLKLDVAFEALAETEDDSHDDEWNAAV